MADPLSITASAVGVIVPALHGTRLLLEDLQQLKDAPKTVKCLIDDVHSVHATLELLQGVEDGDWKSLGQSVADQSKATISSCTQACNLFRADLQKYSSVRHSHITEEIKKAISTKQDDVNSAITTSDRQLVVVENKLEELNLSSDDDDVVGSSQGKDEKLLNELLSKSQEEAIAKVAGNQTGSITVTFGPQNSGFQAGNINGGVNGMNFGGK
ncbi:MAG: hypothetical protein Q9228_005514 [Teloschistes exilis]